jgi:hypothetical protein
MTEDPKRHAVLAMESGEPIAVTDAFNDARFNRAHLRKHNIRSILVAPLMQRGRLFGVVFFNLTRRRTQQSLGDKSVSTGGPRCSVFWMEERGQSVRDRCRGSQRLVGIAQNISKRRRAEKHCKTVKSGSGSHRGCSGRGRRSTTRTRADRLATQTWALKATLQLTRLERVRVLMNPSPSTTTIRAAGLLDDWRCQFGGGFRSTLAHAGVIYARLGANYVRSDIQLQQPPKAELRLNIISIVRVAL